MKTGSLTIAGRTGFLGETGGKALLVVPVFRGVVALGGAMDSAGTVSLWSPDGSCRRVNARQDLFGMLSLAGMVAPRISGGVSAKLVRSELVEEFETQLLLFDAGVQVQPREYLKFGLALKNIGSDEKYEEESVTRPFQAQGGFALLGRLSDVLPHAVSANSYLVLVGDCEYELRQDRHLRPEGEFRTSRSVAVIRAGLEYQWGGILALRVGGKIGEEKSLGNLSAGLSVGLKDTRDKRTRRFRLDYSTRLLTEELDAPQALSLTVSF